MHNNLIEMNLAQFDDDIIEQMSSLLDLDRTTTKTAVESAITSELSEILEFTVTDKDSRLLDILRNINDRLLDQLSTILSNTSNHGELFTKGFKMLESLVGEEKLSSLVAALSHSNDVDQESMRSIVSITAPVIFSSIKRVAKNEDMNKQNLATFLAEQKEYVARSPQVKLANHLQPEPAKTKASLFNNLAYMAILVGLAFSAYNFIQSKEAINFNENQNNSTSAVPIQNEQKSKETVSITQVQLIDLLTTIGGIVANINNIESAKIALPIIQDATTQLDNLYKQYNDLSDTEKKRINTVVGENINALKSTENELNSIDGVGLVLEEAMGNLVKKLKMYTRS
jgi:hypothetical protein